MARSGKKETVANMTKARTFLAVGLVAAFTVSGLTAGCTQGGKDTGTVVAAPQQQSTADIERQIKEVEANPNMPAAQKQMVMGRLRGQLAEAQQRESAAKQAGGK